MKPLMLALSLTLIFPSISALAAGTGCKSVIDAWEGAPFSPVEKSSALAALREQSELTDEENALVLSLLRSPYTEAYSAFDSTDSGFHLLLVRKGSCELLWAGFIFHY
jgi:hypothetical protein